MNRDDEVLSELEAACRNHTEVGYMQGWARPLDCGGHNGSDHSYRLSKMVKYGWVETRQRSAFGSRGSKAYRITETGRARLAEQRNAKA